MVYTYIMKHNITDNYYCGKTNNMERRMKEHTNDRWKNYKLIWYIRGDYEKRIKTSGLPEVKKFGVNQFINCVIPPEVKYV